MGGAASEVNVNTTTVVVESAIFDPVSIRRTAFRYALRSDASLRFEKGQEWRLARIGADRTAGLVADWAGGRIAPGAVDTDPSESSPVTLAFRPARVNRLLGTAIDVADQRALLGRVGVSTAMAPIGTQVRVVAGDEPLDIDPSDTEVVLATTPTWRRDLAVEADIAEEIIRVHGYDRVPGRTPHTPMPGYRHDPLTTRDRIRHTLQGAGLNEVVTFALVAPESVERFPPADVANLPNDRGQQAVGRPVVVTNPLSSQHSVLRQSLVGSLLDVVSSNIRQGRGSVAVFEIGKGYGAVGSETHEWWRLGLALTGPARPLGWDETARDYDLGDAKGLIELACRDLGFEPPSHTPMRDDRNLHPGRTARVASGDDLAGWVGELHPRLIDELDLRAERILIAELAVAGLAAGRPTDYRVSAPSRQPTVQRDVAVVVGEVVPAADVAAAIRQHAGPLLRGLVLFDIYRGQPLDAADKSLAYRLTLRDDDRTLTDVEVDSIVASVNSGLATDLGARSRG
jgi:phenylalanyl-tRNA synthetase beta chain